MRVPLKWNWYPELAALAWFGLAGCVPAGQVPNPRPACIALDIRNDSFQQVILYASYTHRRIATVEPLSEEHLWLDRTDIQPDGAFAVTVRQLAGETMAMPSVPVRCHDGKLYLDVHSLFSTSSLYTMGR